MDVDMKQVSRFYVRRESLLIKGCNRHSSWISVYFLSMLPAAHLSELKFMVLSSKITKRISKNLHHSRCSCLISHLIAKVNFVLCPQAPWPPWDSLQSGNIDSPIPVLVQLVPNLVLHERIAKIIISHSFTSYEHAQFIVQTSMLSWSSI